jgi:MFS family permease
MADDLTADATSRDQRPSEAPRAEPAAGHLASGSAYTAEADAFARRHLRHNLGTLGADYALFVVGMTFASQSTILPAFAEHLGATNLVIGAIPALMTLGWFLPSLFAAPYTTTLPRKLPFVLRWTIWERVPFVVLALVAFLLAGPAPRLSLVLFLACLLAITGVGGLLMPAWMDIVGRCVPRAMRGRFFALANLSGTLGGFLGGLATTWVLGALAPPASYGVCFAAAAIFVGLSYVALVLVREPEGPVVPMPSSLRAQAQALRDLLRGDRNLTAYLIARAFAVTGNMASGFYTVHALRSLGAAEWQVGVFTSVLLVGQLAGNAVFGWLADRTGHRLVILTGMAAAIVANAVALAAPPLETFTLVFVLVGLQAAAISVSNLNVLLEFAPTVAARPTYIGLGTTAIAPMAFGAPLVAGALADRFGFPAVFGTAGLAGLIGLVILATRVRDPRRAWGADSESASP